MILTEKRGGTYDIKSFEYNSDIIKTINNNKVLSKEMTSSLFQVTKLERPYCFLKRLMQEVDYIVTYGSSTSNHCRVIANLAAQKASLFDTPPMKNQKIHLIVNW